MSAHIVADTILQQLGGRRFALMTGAKSFTGSADALSFRLPGAGGFCRSGINRMRVTLTPADTYTVEAWRVRGASMVMVAQFGDVYADNLRDVFTTMTGLETSMGGG